MTLRFRSVFMRLLFFAILNFLFLSACNGGSGQSDSPLGQASDSQPGPTSDSPQEPPPDPKPAPDSWKNRFSTVDISLFNNPVLIYKDGVLRILSQDDPAGLFFRKAVLREEVYRVTVSGETEEGYTMLRIKFDDTEPIYVALDLMNGDFSFEFSDVGRIELLIYSETTYGYGLMKLSIDPCESCVHSSISNARLKTRILSENPGLESTVEYDTLMAAEILTDWVAQTEDLGNKEGPAKFNTALIEVSPPGWIQDNLWDKDIGGTFCQGFATYLDKVFNLFGIKSFVITMGYDQTYFTHVTTIVVIDDADGKRFFMFDPTFNGTFVDALDGARVDLATLFEQHATLGMEGIESSFESMPISRTIFVHESRIERFMSNLSESGTAANCPASADEDGFFVCRDFSGGMAYYRVANEEALSQMNIDPSRILESLLIEGGVISTNWVNAEEDRNAFEALLQKHNVSH